MIWSRFGLNKKKGRENFHTFWKELKPKVKETVKPFQIGSTFEEWLESINESFQLWDSPQFCQQAKWPAWASDDDDDDGRDVWECPSGRWGAAWAVHRASSVHWAEASSGARPERAWTVSGALRTLAYAFCTARSAPSGLPPRYGRALRRTRDSRFRRDAPDLSSLATEYRRRRRSLTSVCAPVGETKIDD